MVEIAVESPLNDEMRALIQELNATLLAWTPAEFCHHMSVEQMADSETTVFTARSHGQLVGCGALRRHPHKVGEVKRMFTRPNARKQGIGAMILDAIIKLAQAEGLSSLVLETGNSQGFQPALKLYEKAGFFLCDPVLDYQATDHNIFYQKALLV